MQLESLGIVKLLVTQNIDRLHQFAGHKNVIDLHGRLDQVICLSCGHIGSRAVMQERLIDLNPCKTRADGMLSLKISEDCSAALGQWVDSLS